MRDIDKNPYSYDEMRVAKFFADQAGIGGGDDPIGSLIASHRALADERNRYKAALNYYAQSSIHGARAREALNHD